ncbi:ArdC-like ssDNA-binding domain-containing protein [Nocardioides sp. YJ-D4]
MAWNQDDAPPTRHSDHKAQARAKRQVQLEVMHERLVGEVERLVTGDDWRRTLEFATRFRSRSFHNVLLIHKAHEDNYAQGLVATPAPTYVAGFRQWQSLGRSVMKGQPGTQIMAPVKVRVASKTPEDPSTWRRLASGEQAKPGESTRYKMAGLRPAYVWDISQTEGDPIPEPPKPKLLEGAAPDGLWEALAEHITERGFDLRLVSNATAIGGTNGLTDFMTRSVSVRVDMDDAAMVRTLAHEAGHVLLHSPIDMQQDAARHRGIKEVEAEGVSMMVTGAHGMDSSQYTVPYVSTWASQVPGTDPVQVVQDTAARVRGAAVSILNNLDTEKVPDGTPPGLDRNDPARSPTMVDQSHPARDASSVESPGL